MTSTTTKATERRRNQYADACRVCGVPVPAGQGWLYSCTDARGRSARFNRRGGFTKFVKCDRCHGLKAVRRSDLPESRPAPPPTLGVNDVRRGTFRPRAGKPPWSNWRQGWVELVLPDGAAEVVAFEQSVTCQPYGVKADAIEGRLCFGGRALTKAARLEVERLGHLAVHLFEGLFADPRECE